MNANSYAAVGAAVANREWLGDTLTILEPEKTPFTAMISKATDAKSTFHEVLADKLRAPRISGTREGDSGPKGGNKTTKRARFGSYLHRWMDTFGVTDVQQAIAKAGGTAGVTDEYSNAKLKCLREVKRDLESTLLSNQETAGGSESEMQTRGYFKWVSATSPTPAIDSNYLPSTSATGDATDSQVISSVTALLESHLTRVLTALSDQYGGAQEFQAFTGNTYCQDLDLFAVQYGGGSGTKFTAPVTIQGGQTKTVSFDVSVFRTSFGSVVIHNDKFVNITAAGVGNGDAMAIVNPEQWFLTMLEDLHAVDDESDAGGQSGYVKAIGGLFCTMPRGNGAIYGTLN